MDANSFAFCAVNTVLTRAAVVFALARYTLSTCFALLIIMLVLIATKITYLSVIAIKSVNGAYRKSREMATVATTNPTMLRHSGWFFHASTQND